MELDTVDNELELKKHAATVHAKLPGISDDYIYAKIDNETQKQAIIDITDHAYYIQRLIQNMAKKIRNNEWDTKTNNWKEKNINEKQLTELKKIKTKLFDSYMTKIHMYAILNRNKANNHILGHMKQEPGNTDEEDNKNMLDKMKDFMTKPKSD